MTNPANRYQGTPIISKNIEITFAPCISLSGRCLRSALTIKGATCDFNTTNINIIFVLDKYLYGYVKVKTQKTYFV